MPLTMFDSNPTLIVIDLQKGLMQRNFLQHLGEPGSTSETLALLGKLVGEREAAL